MKTYIFVTLLVISTIVSGAWHSFITDKFSKNDQQKLQDWTIDTEKDESDEDLKKEYREDQEEQR